MIIIFIISPVSYSTATKFTLIYHTEVVKLCLYQYLKQIVKPSHNLSQALQVSFMWKGYRNSQVWTFAQGLLHTCPDIFLQSITSRRTG